MITVNLLPPEYRVKERTPLPMMLGILGSVALSALCVVGFLYVRLVNLQQVRETLTTKQTTKQTLMRESQKYDQLKLEKDKLNMLAMAVKKLQASRYRWARAIDDLAWVVDDAGKAEIRSWFTNLNFKMAAPVRGARGPATTPAGKIEFELEIRGKDFAQAVEWRRIIANKDRWLGANIANMSPPNFKTKDYREYEPPTVTTTKLEVDLKPLEPPKPAVLAGPGRPAAGKAAGTGKAPAAKGR